MQLTATIHLALPEIDMEKTTEELFYLWAELAKLNRDACLRGEITVEAFLEWLKLDMQQI